MVFSSMVFLCIFLPCVLMFYTVIPGIRAKNILLLLASLLFYAYGEPVYVLLMIGSAFMNYLTALGIEHSEKGKRKWLVAAVLLNLGVLSIFKYSGFLSLPIGISFFTFQALSYVIDVYRSETKAQKNFGKLLLFISFFPQLIAGPIVKYHDIADEINDREQTAEGVANGIRRFIAGLGKKVLIANFMARIADAAFNAPGNEVNILIAWLGAAAYMLQIYFDFSGYSDMAIGLGWMFGFHFKENFRYPYTACGIRDFWRKWHISLSSWFKDYLYIPLGGNRKGKLRTSINKIIVFLCTGIWHGANVTFLFWGIYHGVFLMLEEYVPFFRNVGGKGKRALLHIYTILVVLIGFVFFRAESMSQGIFWIKQMITGFQFSSASTCLLLSMLTPASILTFTVGVIGCAPWKNRLEKVQGYWALSMAASMAVFVICVLNLAGGTYNPFIYFRF